MPEAAVAASAAICVAVLGSNAVYLYTRRLERRKAPLERLNAQLREFYGPLYAIFEATRIAHIRFVSTLRPGSTNLFAPDVPPLNVGELRLWRLWAMSTHQHRSTPAYEVIINKAHLLIEDEMPQCLLGFCAHKAGYDVVIERWKQGDYTEHLSAVRGLLGHGGAEVSGSRAVRPLRPRETPPSVGVAVGGKDSSPTSPTARSRGNMQASHAV